VDAAWLAAQFDLTNGAVVGIDSNGRVALWNRGAELLFGWSADEVQGQPPPFVPLALLEEWQLQLMRVLETGQATPAAETQRVTRDGHSINVVRTSSPVFDARGQTIGLVDLLIDATALKQLDDESRALALLRERDMIAMDLHDGLVQSLYAMVLNLAAREQALGPDAAQAIKDARLEIERVIGEARAYIADLRGRAATPPNLELGLRLLVDSVRLNGGVNVALEFDAAVEPLLTPEVRGHVLYLVREAVANVLRHAAAAHVSITLGRSDGLAVLKIEDDGRGFDATAAAGRGLHNMAERARLVGGTLEVSSALGRGTTVCLELPL
jgi:PAS domain S-box-containing protein